MSKDDKIELPKGAIRLPIIKQETETSCGAAVLMSILRYWNTAKEIKSENELRKILKTNKYGTKSKKIIEIAHKFGLNAKGSFDNKINDIKEAIKNGLTPIVTIQAWPEGQEDYCGHYVAAICVDEQNIYFMDPMVPGYNYIDIKSFEENWYSTDYDDKNIAKCEIILISGKSNQNEINRIKLLDNPLNEDKSELSYYYDAENGIIVVNTTNRKYRYQADLGIFNKFVKTINKKGAGHGWQFLKSLELIKDPTWILPKLDKEINNLKLAAEKLNINQESLIIAFKSGRPLQLDEQIWDSLINIGQDDRTENDKLINQFYGGDRLAPPIIIKEKHKYYLINGNDKLIVSKTLDVKPFVYLIEFGM